MQIIIITTCSKIKKGKGERYPLFESTFTKELREKVFKTRKDIYPIDILGKSMSDTPYI